MTTDAPRVRTERHGRILVVTMQRIDKRNAIDRAMADALDDALNELDDDPRLLVGVLTGGTSVFCAGTDLREPASPATERGGEYGIVRRWRRAPLIAAVEGVALGGGFEIVLACDLVVAARSATFGLPEVRRGVIASCGALFRAAPALPPNVARHLLLTGEPISAEAAHLHGLVTTLAEDGHALDEALRLAELVARNAPTSIVETLQAVDRFSRREDELGWSITADASATVRVSADRREGITAFFERREPNWPG